MEFSKVTEGTEKNLDERNIKNEQNTKSKINEEDDYCYDEEYDIGYDIEEAKDNKESEFDIFVEKNKEYLSSMLAADQLVDDVPRSETFGVFYQSCSDYKAKFDFINGMMLEKLKGEYNYESIKAILKKLNYRGEDDNLGKNWPDESADYIISEFVKTDNFKPFTEDVLFRDNDSSWLICIYNKLKSVRLVGINIKDFMTEVVLGELNKKYNYESICAILKNFIELESFGDQNLDLLICSVNKKFIETKNFADFVDETLSLPEDTKNEVKIGLRYIKPLAVHFDISELKNMLSVIHNKINGEYNYAVIKRIFSLFPVGFINPITFPCSFVNYIISDLIKSSNFEKFLLELALDKNVVRYHYLNIIFKRFDNDSAQKIMINLVSEKLLVDDKYNFDDIKLVLDNIGFFKPTLNHGFITSDVEKNVMSEFIKTKNFERFVCDVMCQNNGFGYLNYVFGVQKENATSLQKETAYMQEVIIKNIKNKLVYLWQNDLDKVPILVANISKLNCIDNSARKNMISELTKTDGFVEVIFKSALQSDKSSLDAIDFIYKFFGEVDIKNVDDILISTVLERFFDKKKYNYDDIYKLIHSIPLVKQFKNIRNDICDKIKSNDGCIMSNFKHFISDALVGTGGYKALYRILEFSSSDKCVTDTLEKLILIAFKEVSSQEYDHNNIKKLLFNIIILTGDDRFKNLFDKYKTITEFVQADNYKALIDDLSKKENKSIQELANLKLFKKFGRLSKPVPKLATEKSGNSIEETNK